ncbi:YfbM family protein [Myroides pelagicus]|uniref:YfbM family protein n=1 Tax=Myroides pelagicus TaxID=270914 RepID=UPI0012B83A62|nr:YfbM family protein [Myroides pelagicus]MEC4114660.1 YfbM family protein [Myroides pelagicus]
MGLTATFIRLTEGELCEVIHDGGEGNIRGNQLINIDKSWDAIAFLISNQQYDYDEQPIAKLIFGTHDLCEYSDSEVCYILPEEVKAFNRHLSQLSDEMLYNRLDFEFMETHNVYPNIWDNEAEKEQVWKYLLHWISEVRTFYQKASANNEAIITYIT